MTIYDWLTVAAVVICLLVSAFYSASETALTASSRAAMMRLEKQGNADATIVNRLLGTRERMLGAVLLANNVTNIAASTLATGLLLSALWPCRGDLRDHRDDGAHLRAMRSAAEDRRLQRAGSRGACCCATYRADSLDVLADPESGRMAGAAHLAQRRRSDSARFTRSSRHARSCVARSISCTAPAWWKSSTAT